MTKALEEWDMQGHRRQTERPLQASMNTSLIIGSVQKFSGLHSVLQRPATEIEDVLN